MPRGVVPQRRLAECARAGVARESLLRFSEQRLCIPWRACPAAPSRRSRATAGDCADSGCAGPPARAAHRRTVPRGCRAARGPASLRSGRPRDARAALSSSAEAPLAAAAEPSQVRDRTGRGRQRRYEVSVRADDQARVLPPRIEREHALMLVVRAPRRSERREDAPLDGGRVGGAQADDRAKLVMGLRHRPAARVRATPASWSARSA